jgi:hypothetical protein
MDNPIPTLTVPTEVKTETPTKLNFDVKQALLKITESAIRSIDYAYPEGDFDEDNAHTALQMADSELKSIRSILNALS